jgi:pantoate--beta-alanine ligase
VHRLLEIVKPHNLYLGQKDYQQCMVINKLTELIGLSEQIKINICPTLREKDGLAMSSRNMRLHPEERKIAPAIYQSMIWLKENLQAGNLTKAKEYGKKFLAQAGFKVDYFEVVDTRSLETVDEYEGKQKLVCLVAAFLNEVRLIDNMLLN